MLLLTDKFGTIVDTINSFINSNKFVTGMRNIIANLENILLQFG